MPICRARQFIFFHIPRCGGSSLEEAFQLESRDNLHGVMHCESLVITLHHLTAADLLQRRLITQSDLANFFTFSVIRDPFERLVSDFAWQKHHDRHGIFKAMTFKEYLDFAESVVEERRYLNALHFDHFRPMIEYFYVDSEPVLDAVLLLHNLDKEIQHLPFVTQLLTLPRRNSFRTNEFVENDIGLRRRAYELYRDDFDLYDLATSGQMSLLTRSAG